MQKRCIYTVNNGSGKTPQDTEDKAMTATYYMNRKQISREDAEKMIGAEAIEKTLSRDEKALETNSHIKILEDVYKLSNGRQVKIKVLR